MKGEGKSKLALDVGKLLDDLLDSDKVMKGIEERHSRIYSKTAFNKLIMAQNHQIQVITDAYEEEIKDLNIAIESLNKDFNDRIASLEVEKEELEEKLLDLEKKDQKMEPDNEPQPKACQ